MLSTTNRRGSDLAEATGLQHWQEIVHRAITADTSDSAWHALGLEDHTNEISQLQRTHGLVCAQLHPIINILSCANALQPLKRLHVCHLLGTEPVSVHANQSQTAQTFTKADLRS